MHYKKSHYKLNSNTRSYSEKPQEEDNLYIDNRMSELTDRKTELVADMIKQASKSGYQKQRIMSNLISFTIPEYGDESS